MNCVTIQRETSADSKSIRRVVCAAFPTSTEADLVERLRNNGNLVASLVATESCEIVGHIGFSPVSIRAGTPGSEALIGAGLAPVSVLPSHQQKGIGGRLIRAGLDACRSLQIDFVVVLGDPDYYDRFGFIPASELDLKNEYEVDAEFRVIQLSEGCLTNVTGTIQYSSEFRELP